MVSHLLWMHSWNTLLGTGGIHIFSRITETCCKKAVPLSYAYSFLFKTRLRANRLAEYFILWWSGESKHLSCKYCGNGRIHITLKTRNKTDKKSPNLCFSLALIFKHFLLIYFVKIWIFTGKHSLPLLCLHCFVITHAQPSCLSCVHSTELLRKCVHAEDGYCKNNGQRRAES